VSHLFTFLTGAEWWAQDFRKSLPIFGWIPLPFLSGMYCRNYQMSPLFPVNSVLPFSLCLISLVVWLQAYRYCSAFCCSMISVSLINWICVLASASAQITITIVVSNVLSFCLFQKLKSPYMLLCWFLWLWVLLYLLLDPSKSVIPTLR